MKVRKRVKSSRMLDDGLVIKLKSLIPNLDYMPPFKLKYFTYQDLINEVPQKS